MAGLGTACAAILAGVLVAAAVAKAARPGETAAGFAALGVPAPAMSSRALPAAELAVATALLAAPRAGAVAALAVLAAFSVFLARAVRAGVSAGCNCFGRASASPEPVSATDLLRNGLLALLALPALATGGPVWPSPGAVGLAVAGAGTGAVALRAARRRRRRPP